MAEPNTTSDTSSPQNSEDSFTGLSFEEERKEKRVRIKDSEGKYRYYVLREMAGPELDAWREISDSRMKLDAQKKKLVITATPNFLAKLINLCLFHENSASVSVETIGKWSSTIQTKLFKECQDMNNLTDKDDDEGKA
jgi:hypothetical protein